MVSFVGVSMGEWETHGHVTYWCTFSVVAQPLDVANRTKVPEAQSVGLAGSCSVGCR